MFPFTLLQRPEFPLTFGKEQSAFTRGSNERPLILVVDNADSLAPSHALDVLLELGRHDSIDMTTTLDVGLSTITVGGTVSADDQLEVVTAYPDGGAMLSGIWRASSWLQSASEHAQQHRVDLQATTRRFLLAGATRGRVDGLVVGGSDSMVVGRGSNPCSVHQALALVGLFLRSRDDGTIAVTNGTRHVTSVSGQHFIAARGLLDAGWRWWSACVSAGTNSGDERVTHIAEGVQVRFERCLRARDEVMAQCLKPVHDASQEIILYHLDAMLLWLGGTFDATALVVNAAHQVGTPDHLVGWKRRDWRKQLATAAPDLHALTQPGQPARAVIDLVASLRNTVHGAPVHGVQYQSGVIKQHLVELPELAEDEARRACEVLGGPSTWGLVQSSVGPLGGLWDPLVLVQMLVPFAAAALNAIMAKTDVERLPGVDPSKIMSGRPIDGYFDPDRFGRQLLLNGFPYN